MKIIYLIFISLFILMQDCEKNKKYNTNISDIIFEHVNDSHEFNFFDKKHNFYISLPVIIWNNGGIEFFSSSSFRNNSFVKGKYGLYQLYNNTIYKICNNKRKNVLDFSITKNVITILISSLLMSYCFLNMKNNYDTVYFTNKRKFGIFLEYCIIFIKKEIAIPYIGKNEYKIYFPFLLTIFFFILFNNIIGLLPGAPNITGNINITFVLSIVTFFIAIFNSRKKYWKHILWMPGIPKWIRLLLAPIEIISILVKPFTLCIRLFANIIAGHIVMLSFIYIIFIFKNIFITGFSVTFGLFVSILEIMVSFLQSFIFTNLSALLIGTCIRNNNK